MNKILGYIELYFKATTTQGLAYAKITFDFRKPVSKRFLKSTLRNVRDIYEEQGIAVRTIEFCAKEEYENNKSNDYIVQHEWSEE